MCQNTAAHTIEGLCFPTTETNRGEERSMRIKAIDKLTNADNDDDKWVQATDTLVEKGEGK